MEVVIFFKEAIISQNNVGDNIETYKPRLVYANKQSIKQQEYYNMMVIGLKPECVFKCRSIDYHNEETLNYNDKDYNITRTWDTGEWIELICSRSVGDK
jgi:asparagine N-glycosylation enzyme membrane subunit Stt3